MNSRRKLPKIPIRCAQYGLGPPIARPTWQLVWPLRPLDSMSVKRPFDQGQQPVALIQRKCQVSDQRKNRQRGSDLDEVVASAAEHIHHDSDDRQGDSRTDNGQKHPALELEPDLDACAVALPTEPAGGEDQLAGGTSPAHLQRNCLLYTSDAADDLLCVDLGGRRII